MLIYGRTAPIIASWRLGLLSYTSSCSRGKVSPSDPRPWEPPPSHPLANRRRRRQGLLEPEESKVCGKLLFVNLMPVYSRRPPSVNAGGAGLAVGRFLC